MKKTILALALILIVIVIIIVVKISDNSKKVNDIAKFNEQFEAIYNDKIVYGADVLTIINKAIDNNNTYKIKKDNNGYYIDDDKYCLKVELALLITSEEGELKEVQYPMETLEKAGLDGFISSFSLTKFECTSSIYNSNRKNCKN